MGDLSISAEVVEGFVKCAQGGSPQRSKAVLLREHYVGFVFSTRSAILWIVSSSFTITFDYLCPFSRIANEIVAEALDEGANWDVVFRPFSLSQSKVLDGQTPVWERSVGAEGTEGVRALVWSVAVRDEFPAWFRRFHIALYNARFSSGRSIEDEAVLLDTAASVGLEASAVADVVDSGRPISTLALEHDDLVKRWSVFGVPTFIVDNEAVFVRLMNRRDRTGIERVLDMLDWIELNEFKRTSIPR